MNSGGEGEGLAPLPVPVGPIPRNASLAFPGLGRFAGAFVGEGNELHVFGGAAGFTNGNFAGLLRVGVGLGAGLAGGLAALAVASARALRSSAKVG